MSASEPRRATATSQRRSPSQVGARSLRVALRWTLVLLGLATAGLALLLAYGAALVDAAMESSRGPSGVRVLSAPLELRSGSRWTAAELRRSLLARGFAEAPARPPGRGEFHADGEEMLLGADVVEGSRDGMLASCAGGALALNNAAGPAAVALVRAGVIGATAPGDVVRWPVPLAAMAPALVTAVVDTEDRGFLGHAGLSWRGLLRAAITDALSGGFREGGSTITQQLAKVIMLRPARTVARKVLEAWLASLIEYRFDKRTILETYLNRVYLGQDGGWQLQGVEAAARYYFGTSAAALDDAECALLAGLIAAPNRFDPFTHPREAAQRRATVLAAMVGEGHLERRPAAELAGRPLPREPHHLRWQPSAQPVEALLAAGGAPDEVRSTIDPDVQEALVEGSAAGLSLLERSHPALRALAAGGDPLQVGAVALAPDGRVLGLIGSRTARAGEFDRATSASRQVGSLVKPFIVANALFAGWRLDSELLDEPVAVPVDGRTWTPRNSDDTYRGPVSVRDALAYSLNVAMVRLGLERSVGSVADTLRDVGFDIVAPTPAVLLGAFEATPLRVAGAYATLAGAGRRPPLRWSDGGGEAGRQVFPPEVAGQVVEAMGDVVRRGTAAALADPYGGRIAAKTGTTDSRRDSWFVSLSPGLVLVVWVGTDANRDTGLFGATGAMVVWRAIAERLPPPLRP